MIGRLADALALITLAGEIGAVALRMPQLAVSPVDPLLPKLMEEAEEADRASIALTAAYSFACSHAHEFFDSHIQPDRTQHPVAWLGQWVVQTSGNWEYIAFLPSTLQRLFKEAGFEYDPVVSAWKDRGWLKIDKGEKHYHQVALGPGKKPRTIAVLKKYIAPHDAPLDPRVRLVALARDMRRMVWDLCADPALRESISAIDMQIQNWASAQAVVPTASGTPSIGSNPIGTAKTVGPPGAMPGNPVPSVPATSVASDLPQ